MAEGGNNQVNICEQLKPPATLQSTTENIAQIWKPWRDETQLYMDLAHSNKSDAYKVKMLKYLLGTTGRQIYDTLTFENEEKDRTLDEVITAFDNLCNPKKNETVERYKFFTRHQRKDELFESYSTDLRVLASTCNFGELEDSLMRDMIIIGLNDSHLRERILRETDLDLKKCLRMCRSNELTREQIKTLESTSDIHSVKPQKKHQSKPNKSQHTTDKRLRKCKFCVTAHKFGINECPAFGKTCKKCKKLNHSSNVCWSSNTNTSMHKVDESTDSSEEEYDELLKIDEIDKEEISINNIKDQILATMQIGNSKEKPVDVTFEVDSGAHCNIISKKYLKTIKHEIQMTNKRLRMYNKDILVPVGKTCLKFTNPKNNKKYRAEFVVVADDLRPIIGKETAVRMNLIEIKTENILGIKPEDNEEDQKVAYWTKKYPDVFNGIGEFEEPCHLNVMKECRPVVHSPRRVPVATKKLLEKELTRLTDEGIIKKVEKPTPWVSSLVTVIKPNKTRVCIDPKDLNQVLQRSHYPMKTIEDVLPDLSKAKVFSVVDVKDGYWHVKLDEQSSYLTCFNSAFGRFRWLRMPFGLKTSAEEFQRRLEQSLEDLPGICCIADDILIFGEGDTEKDAIEDHNKKLHTLMQRCQEKNIKLNQKKAKLLMKEVKFMGHVISSEGLKPDPAKIQAVIEMPTPQNVNDVRRLVGFVNYLGKFLPSLSDLCEPLRKLTEKDTMWSWQSVHDEALAKVKKAATESPVLRYFDSSKELYLQTDASETGCGAALMQDQQPLAYASRAFTGAETRYAQIEKELLAVVWGLEKFHQYTYGRHSTIESDHKPLEIIQKKSSTRHQNAYNECFYENKHMTAQLCSNQAKRCS